MNLYPTLALQRLHPLWVILEKCPKCARSKMQRLQRHTNKIKRRRAILGIDLVQVLQDYLITPSANGCNNVSERLESTNITNQE